MPAAVPWEVPRIVPLRWLHSPTGTTTRDSITRQHHPGPHHPPTPPGTPAPANTTRDPITRQHHPGPQHPPAPPGTPSIQSALCLGDRDVQWYGGALCTEV